MIAELVDMRGVGLQCGMEFRLRNTALAADHHLRLEIQATENAR